MNTYTEDDLRQALAGAAEETAPPVDVWPRLRRRVARRTWMRSGVAAGVVAVAAVSALLAVPSSDDTVRVPPAQDTGSTTTLVPDRPLSDAELRKAVDALRHRLDSLGVQHATVATQDGDVLIDASGTNQSDIAAIAVRGELQFRSVTAMGPASDCTPGNGAVACSPDGAVQYSLGPIALDNHDVQSADAVVNSVDGSWLVQLAFTADGADKFHTLTADAAAVSDQGGCQPPQPCGEIAIVLDGTVVEAPTVQQPGGITGGQTQISGAMTKETAQTLAALATTDPLPTSFRVSD